MLATPSAQTAGTAFNETITAGDTWGNTTTGYAGTKSVTFTGPSNAPNGTVPSYPSTVSFTSGVGTATSIKLYDAQTTTLTATQGTITGTSASFTVSAAAANAGIGLATVTTSPNPALSCSGAVGSITCTSSGENPNSGNVLVASLQLEDTYGNAWTNTGTSVSIALATSGSGSGSPSSLSVANGASATSGTFTVTRSNGFSKTVTMTAKVGGVTKLTITMSS